MWLTQFEISQKDFQNKIQITIGGLLKPKIFPFFVSLASKIKIELFLVNESANNEILFWSILAKDNQAWRLWPNTDH